MSDPAEGDTTAVSSSSPSSPIFCGECCFSVFQVGVSILAVLDSWVEESPRGFLRIGGGLAPCAVSLRLSVNEFPATSMAGS